MSAFRRMFVTVKSRIDTATDHFENHEALAGAAIKDLQAISSKTAIHLRHIQELSNRQKLKLDELNTEADRWSERAVAVRDQDEQRALECVKRLRYTRTRIEQIEKQFQESWKVEVQIRSDLDKIQNKLQNLKKKKELLAARQNRVDVMSALDRHHSFYEEDIQDVFERWEDRVTGGEFQYQDMPEEDPFAADFEKKEEEVELKEMLEDLVQKSKKPYSENVEGDEK